MQTSQVSIEKWLNLFALDLLFVMLVVLILFMAITPFSNLPVHVDVPTARFASHSPESSLDLTIHVPRPGVIVFNDELVSLAEIDQRLVPARRGVYNTVRIRAARNIPYGTVRRLVQWARDAGYTRVTFVVRRAPEPARLDMTVW